MSAKSSIQWTDATWTPIRAKVRTDAAEIARAKGYTSLVQIAAAMAGHVGPHCEHCTPGCDNCYSETSNGRCLPANGTGLPFDRRSRDLVEIHVDEKILEQPLHWRAPRKIFVCSQTDLFGEFVTDEMIDRVFAVMALCPQHTFQVLTKRAERMRGYVAAFKLSPKEDGFVTRGGVPYSDSPPGVPIFNPKRWPLSNVWLGVSVEDQPRADERISHLLATPAALRFVSAEPLLGPVNLCSVQVDVCIKANVLVRWCDHPFGSMLTPDARIDWVIVGGESGPGARPCDIAWVRSIVAQCAAAGVACFVKQLGALPVIGPEENLFDWPQHVVRDVWNGGDKVRLRDKKGGDPSEWPAALRVRQMPEARS